jgi:hypothetical protein
MLAFVIPTPNVPIGGILATAAPTSSAKRIKKAVAFWAEQITVEPVASFPHFPSDGPHRPV